MTSPNHGKYKLQISVGFVEISDEDGVLLRVAKGEPIRQMAGMFRSFGWTLKVENDQ